MPSISLLQTIQTLNYHSLYRPMRIAWLLIFFTLSQNLIAQDRCSTIAPTSGEFESWIQQKILQKQLERVAKGSQPPIYQIPVVVHILHNGEAIGSGANLTEERIRGQIDSLNADFRRTNADAINTPTDFLPFAADVEMQFVLARQDPNGNPTNGIIRKKGERNSYSTSSHSSVMRSESYWSPENYLNFVVADLLSPEIGRSSFPITSLEGITTDSRDLIFDGIFIDYQYFGVNPSAPSFESYGRTVTHEIGHYLGLRHIWGDGNCNKDDYVSDTPPADDDNGGLSSPCSFPNLDDSFVCDTPEMFQNYMDYTDDICMNLFTEGQKTRMRTVMENSPRRVSLVSSPGLVEPTRFLNDLAILKITSPDFTECSQIINPNVEIINFGTNEVTSFDIQLIIDGNPIQTLNLTTSLSPLASEFVSFPPRTISSTPSNLSFIVSNVNGTNDGNNSNNQLSHTLSETSSIGLPYSEDFEEINSILGNIGVSVPWEVAIAPRNSAGNKALKFKSYNNEEAFGDQTILKTPIFDLSGFSSAELNFSYAYAHLPDGFWDGLVVKVSTDCGDSFSGNYIFSKFGSSLSLNKSNANDFTPASNSDWQDEKINITQFTGIDGVQFAFVGVNGGGNNIFLDDISVLQTNLNANDISPISITAPIITCSEQSSIQLRVRNVGYENIHSFEANYAINEFDSIRLFNGLNIVSGQFQTFKIDLENLIESENQFHIELTQVNGVDDESDDGNALEATLIRNLKSDSYPLKVDFESPDQWLIGSTNGPSLWVRDATNGRLKASAFNAVSVESQSWFVSPVLTTEDLDSAGLYFRASYASRNGFNDQLEVKVSIDCGENYGPSILIANSDSLAITQTSSQWVPSSDSDWKEFRLDISNTILFKSNIRVAFVFTNGNGNDLYIDDISIQGNEAPTYSDVFRVFPNPASDVFNVGLNLPEKESVTIQLMDMSGRIIFEKKIDNALNQIVPYQNKLLSGLYFVRVIGNRFVSSQKIVINRN
jgi:hypothetical protein